MNQLLRLLLVTAFICAGIAKSPAQAPTSLTDFTNRVIRFQTVTNPLGGALVGALIRITPTNSAPFTNGTALLSGQLFSTGEPTNAFYTQFAGDRALLRLQSFAAASFRATNEVTLTFLSATNGFFTNAAIFSSNPVRQTNAIGLFTVIPGTNAVPAVDYATGGGVIQPGNAMTFGVSGNGFGPMKYQLRLNVPMCPVPRMPFPPTSPTTPSTP